MSSLLIYLILGLRLCLDAAYGCRAKSLVIKSLATVSATFGIKNGLHSVGQLWRCLNSGNKQNTFKTAVSELWQTVAWYGNKPSTLYNLSALDS